MGKNRNDMRLASEGGRRSPFTYTNFRKGLSIETKWDKVEQVITYYEEKKIYNTLNIDFK